MESPWVASVSQRFWLQNWGVCNFTDFSSITISKTIWLAEQSAILSWLCEMQECGEEFFSFPFLLLLLVFSLLLLIYQKENLYLRIPAYFLACLIEQNWISQLPLAAKECEIVSVMFSLFNEKWVRKYGVGNFSE